MNKLAELAREAAAAETEKARALLHRSVDELFDLHPSAVGYILAVTGEVGGNGMVAVRSSRPVSGAEIVESITSFLQSQVRSFAEIGCDCPGCRMAGFRLRTALRILTL